MTTKTATADQTVIARTAHDIKNLIRQRRIALHGILPNYHELCTEFGVSYMTVHRGMAQLEHAGLVRRVRGKGTFVTKELSAESRELRHIGIIYPSSRGSLLMNKPWLSEILKGISDASPRGGDLHIFSFRSDGLVRASHLQQSAVDGTILLELGNDDYLRAYASWGTPGVVVDYRPGSDVPLDHVTSDNDGATTRVVEHLAALGHRTVAVAVEHPLRMVVDPQRPERTLLKRLSSDAIERREAMLRALAERGMRAREIVPDSDHDTWTDKIVRQLLAWRSDADRPTAVLTTSDETAHTLLAELTKAGMRVPDDLSLCAVAGSASYARQHSPQVTCCHIDFIAMGRWSVERLAERCRQPVQDAPSGKRIGFNFIIGTTTGPGPERM